MTTAAPKSRSFVAPSVRRKRAKRPSPGSQPRHAVIQRGGCVTTAVPKSRSFVAPSVEKNGAKQPSPGFRQRHSNIQRRGSVMNARLKSRCFAAPTARSTNAKYHCLRVQTHHHHSRYPKSRLFGYLPDLPYVISCMNPVVMMMRSSPTSPRLYPAVQAHSIAEGPSQAKLQRWVPRLSLFFQKSTFWVPPRFTIGRHLLHEPRNAEPSSPFRISLPKSLDPTQHHQSRYPKSRLFGYLPDLPSDVSSCMNPVTRWVLRPVGPQGAAHGLGYIQMPHVSAPGLPTHYHQGRYQKVDSAPGLALNRSVSPGDPTHHHQSRYPKSRLFDYLPDLPSDVISCVNPVMLNPSPHKRYHCPRVEAHHRQSRYPKSRLFGYLPDLPYVISCMNPVVMMMVDFLGTSQIYHRTSDVIACMNPVMLNPSPHKGYHCLRVQTHHRHSRYPKSRLFGYLPDLPYVISCMNPVVMMMRSSPTSPRLYPAVQAHSIAKDPSQAKLQRWVPR